MYLVAMRPPRVFVSYSHDSNSHAEEVRLFATFLRTELGIDARLDQWYEEHRQDWSTWAIEQLAEADFILAVASPAFRARVDGRAPADKGRGAQFEGAILRDKMTQDRPTWTRRILPVVLPGRSVSEVPDFLTPYAATHYEVKEINLAGVEDLHRVLVGAPRHKLPPLGPLASPSTRPTSAEPSRVTLLTSLTPARKGGDVRLHEADLGGEHYANSIVYRSELFASESRGVIDFVIGRKYRRLHTVAGVLDAATDSSQVGHFQVFLDGEPQPLVTAGYGTPKTIEIDVTDVLRVQLVAYRPGTNRNALLAGANAATGRSNLLPELAWGDPTLR